MHEIKIRYFNDITLFLFDLFFIFKIYKTPGYLRHVDTIIYNRQNKTKMCDKGP